MAEKKQYLDEIGLRLYHQDYVAKNIKALQGLVDDNATAIDAHEALVLDEVIPSILKSAFSKIVVTDNSSTYNFESTKTVDSSKSGSDGSTFTIKAGEGITLTPDITNLALTIASKTYSVVTQSSDGLMSSGDKTKLDGIEDGANKYILPAAGKAVIGGVFVADGDNLTLNTTTGELKLTKDNVVAALEYTPLKSVPTAAYNTLGLLKPSKSYSIGATLGTEASADSTTTSISVNAITSTTSRYYAVEVDKNGVPFVNVPWKNTEYKANRGLSLSSGYFGHSNERNNSTETTIKEGGVTRTLGYGGTFNIPSITYDQYGHIVDSGSITLTLPASDNTDTKVTAVGNHYTPAKSGTYDVDASSTTKASWGSTSFITGVTLGKDAAGHITGLSVDSIQFPSLPTKSDIGLGNVENTALSTWTGSTSITTLGTITAGTWNSGAFLIGTPTAPTASKGTNTTQIATTAFVQTALGDYYTQTEINNKLVSSMTYKGSKDYYADLPESNNTVGDVWNVVDYDSSKTDWGHNYAWNGTSWDDLGGNVDLSNYYTKAQSDSNYLAAGTPYAASSTKGGSASSAVKLDSSAGSTSTPVYFSSGKPTVCSYSFNTTEPTTTSDDTTIPTSKAVFNAILTAVGKAIAASY